MKWLFIIPVLYIIWQVLTRKSQPVAVEEYREPPEFESVTIQPRRPSGFSAAAREQRQFDSSGLDDL